MTTAERIDARRAGERPRTQISWLDSKHSFSFTATTTTAVR